MRKSILKRRIISAFAACALVAGLFSTAVFGAGANVLDKTAADADPAGPGYKLTIGGLEAGDTATYYQVIDQLEDTEDENGNLIAGTQKWRLTTAVDANGDGIVDGTENAEFGHKVAGPDGKIGTDDDVEVNGLYIDELVIGSYEEEDDVITSDTRQLTKEMVNALAAAVTNNRPEATGTATANAEGKIIVEGPASGMYMFTAVPGGNNKKYIYKPVFVSYDYYNNISMPEDNTHKIDLVTPGENAGDPEVYADYAGDDGVFKKSPLEIDKKSGSYDENGDPIDMQQDVAVGDVIDFSITVPIPTYSSNYVAPMFYITDVLTEGLKLDASSITVVVTDDAGDEVTTALGKDYKVYTKTSADVTSDTTASYYDFKNTEDEESTLEGFVVQFLNDDPSTTDKSDGFLYKVLNAPTCTITYKATVTETDKQKFAQQVNQMDNTAKLNYSSDPNYIPDGYFKEVEKEVVKVDDDGNPIPRVEPKEVPVLDEDGNPVIDDETGEPVTEPLIDPETGEPVYEQVVDPVTGEPVYETETQTVVEPDPDFDTNDPDTKSEPETPDGEGQEETLGLLQDKTRHYTFDIDADVLGRDQSGDTTPGQGGEPGEPLDESEHDKTSEIRKIWLDANGKVIQKKKTSLVVKDGDEEDGVTGEAEGNYGWLEGAEFTLTRIAKHVTTFTGADGQTGTEEFQELAADDYEQMKFDASSHIRVTSGGANPKSDAKGYIAMKGLDAGVYVLKEIKAPLGYAFNPNIQYRITITPTYVMEPPTPDEGTTPEDGKGGADDLILESYEVRIVTQELDDKLNIVSESEVTTISTYNMKQDEDGNPISLLKEDGSSNVDPESTPAGTGGVDVFVESFGNNETAMIVNKRLGVLPATGGSGLIFYVLLGGAVAFFFGFMIRKVRKAGGAG